MKRVCILTGGSSGIGLATAELLAKEGFTVYELSRSGKDAANIVHLTADVTDAAQVRGAVSKVLSAEGRIDLLVCNAGSASPARWNSPTRRTPTPSST